MKKQLFIFLLVFMLVVRNVPMCLVAAASDSVTVNNDIEIDYSVKESKVKAGGNFNLTLSFSNISSSTINEITVTIPTNTNFTPGVGDSVKIIKDDESYEFNINYLGDTDTIPITVKYTKNGNRTGIANLTLSELGYDDSSNSGGSTSLREPNLIIENSSIPSASAGETLKMPLTITNNSTYQAKNIDVKLSLDSGDQNPFDVDSLNLTQTINTLSSKKSDSVNFSMKVNPYAQEKTYGLKVDLKYSNQQGTSFTSTETVYVKIKNETKGPVLVLKNIKSQPETVNAGEKVNISFDLSNIGDMDAKAIKVTLTGLKKDEFTILNGSGTDYIDKIAGGENINVFYNLNTSDTMENGNYALGLKVEYKDGSNNKTADENTLFVNVQGKAKGSNVSIKNIVLTPDGVMSNESFSLSFDVQNDGKSRAEAIKVTIKGEEGIMSKSQDVRLIEGLEPGQVEKIDFMMFAGDQLKSKNYNIQISLEYEDSAKKDIKYTTNQYAGIYVNGSNSKLIPKIIINNYLFQPNVVRAGEEFSLDMSFLNTSSTKTVRNIKIFLTGIDSDKEGKVVFTPVNSSNTFFIDYIEPKKSAKTSLTMYTIPDAQPMTYTITANFEYQDEEGTEYKSTELIGIPVIQQSKIDAGEINMPPEAYIGQPSPVNIQYFNKGKTKLTNLMITVDGDFDIQNKQAYIGNFESGNSDSFEAIIIPQKPGMLNGKIIFSFDDPSGEPQEFTREFSVNAIDMPPMEPPTDMPPEGMNGENSLMDKTVKNKFFWMGLVGTAIVGLVGFKIWRKRKKGIELDE